MRQIVDLPVNLISVGVLDHDETQLWAPLNFISYFRHFHMEGEGSEESDVALVEHTTQEEQSIKFLKQLTVNLGKKGAHLLGIEKRINSKIG